jgi:3-deoxy-D-manno-octulosonic-acid transferase
MEELKRTNPELELILTFFSPSGYEIRKNYTQANVFYLPVDLPGNAGKWISSIQPDLAVFVKYDLWPGYLNALITKHIPFLLMSAHFRPGTMSSWSIPPTSYLLKKAKAIFLQDGQWIEELNRIGFENIRVAGDTRIDRTLEIANETQQQISKLVLQFGTFDLVAGSTWKEDEDILIPVIEKLKLKTIIAPHDIRESHLQILMERMQVPAVRLSTITKLDDSIKVLVVDSIGQLAYLYSLGKMAYIGGGFGKGIHNILEPAAHRLPVIFGPRYHKFPEAEKLIQAKAAIAVNNQSALQDAIMLFTGEPGKVAGERAFSFLEKNSGATPIISSYIREFIP